MVELAKRRSALDAVYAVGRHGEPDGPAGVSVAERRGLAMAHVECRIGDTAAKDALGLKLPGHNKTAEHDGVRVLWLGPARWLAVAAETEPGALARMLGERSPTAAVNDASSSRTVLRLSGPNVRDALAAGTPLDIDASVFTPGMAATTVCEHFTVTLDCIDTHTIDVYVARGFAQSWFEWLLEAAAEFGVEVQPAK